MTIHDDKPYTAIIGCGDKKAIGRSRAIDLYTGKHFNYIKQYAQTVCGDIYILSARHGLLHQDDVIEPYQLTLKTMTRDQRNMWATIVADQARKVFTANSKLLVLAGRDYRIGLTRLGYICPFIEITPEVDWRMGYQKSWLLNQTQQPTWRTDVLLPNRTTQ